MKKTLPKKQAHEAITAFFKKASFTGEEARKIKRLAMKYRIRLGRYKRQFCRFCLSQLKGKTRISKGYKCVACQQCGEVNRFKII